MPTKHQRIIALLEQHSLDALLIQQVSNFAWATDGAASYINTASTKGVASLLITKEARHLITNNIEVPRFEKEEKLHSAGWQFHLNPWYQSSETIAKLAAGLKLGSDLAFPGAVDLAAELAVARSYLDAAEQARFRTLAALCGQAMDDAIRAVKPGMREFEIAALLSSATHRRGVLPTVILIATDERVFNFRHPLPTAKRMKKYAMLVLCGRQHGLVCSITRLVHFGALDDALKAKEVAVAYVDAAMIAATRPGRTVADVFQAAKDAYVQAGYPDEWQLHHQGGPAGYDPREFVATDAADVPVAAGQVYAWNPSITGTKSEDSILIGEQGSEILSAIPGWPVIPIEVNGQTIQRPAILVFD